MWKLNYKTNATTASIYKKGYTLPEFLVVANISLRTYRRWQKVDSGKYAKLRKLIKQLENKDGNE